MKLFACWVISHALVVIYRHFSKLSFNFFFRNTVGVSKGLDPDQVRHSVGPDLGPNPGYQLTTKFVTLATTH